jgi:hypothetical protein
VEAGALAGGFALACALALGEEPIPATQIVARIQLQTAFIIAIWRERLLAFPTIDKHKTRHVPLFPETIADIGRKLNGLTVAPLFLGGLTHLPPFPGRNCVLFPVAT